MCNTTVQDVNKVVLVNPHQVVHAEWNKSQVEQFYPFLHCLPDKLQPLPSLFQAIGIKSFLEPCHIQIVLEKVYEATAGAEIDTNAELMIKRALYVLENFFKVSPSSIDLESHSPLYLPDSKNIMRPSKSLLYADTINYWGDMTLDLRDVPYFYFDIKTADYNIDAPVLSGLLPEVVRPIGLSTVCKQEVLDSSKKVASSDLAQQLMTTLKIEEIPEGIVSFLNRFVGKQENESDLKEVVRCFFAKIEVMTVEDLSILIVLKESSKPIGTIDTNFCFVSGETRSKLYFDSSPSSPVDDDNACLEVAKNLCEILCQNMRTNVTADKKAQNVFEITIHI